MVGSEAIVTRRAALHRLLAASGSSLLLGCAMLGYPSVGLRYRITVEVYTTDGPCVGSSIIESTLTSGPRTGEGAGLHPDLKGEAVAIDLPHGKTLFALMRSQQQRSAADFQDQLFNKALNNGAISRPPMPRLYKSSEWAEMRRVANDIKPSLILPMSLYPAFVSFDEINDPSSVDFIDVGNSAHKLGRGAVIKKIELAVTDEPISLGILERFSWRKQYVGRHLDGTSSSSDDMTKENAAAQLSLNDFSTEARNYV